MGTEERTDVKKSMVLLATVALLVALLASAGYAVRDTHVMKHWHPMFVEPALGYFGLSFFGHDHTLRDRTLVWQSRSARGLTGKDVGAGLSALIAYSGDQSG
jgi:hypothetical protein